MAKRRDKKTLFEAALAITSPWFIDTIEFDTAKRRLDICISFERGSVFPSNEHGYDSEYKAYDTVEKIWRHLKFFGHECYPHCGTPRIELEKNKLGTVSPPWAVVNTGFTLLFEALTIEFCSHLPVKLVSRMINEKDKKLRRLLEKYIDSARESENVVDVARIGRDETSKIGGQNHISLFVDLDKKRTIYVADSRDNEAVSDFENDFRAHQGAASKVTDVSCDMSPAFIRGTEFSFGNARIAFDRFHIVKLVNNVEESSRTSSNVDSSAASLKCPIRR